MIMIEKKIMNNHPLLWVESTEIHNRTAPLLIFWHGWTSFKEKNIHYAYMAAEKGFRVLLPDAAGHGERIEELSETERKVGFWKVVLESLHETEALLDLIKENGWAADEQVIVGGTSMGAIITLGALKAFPQIDAGISLMGNPYYQRFAEQQLNAYQQANVVLPYTEKDISLLLQALDAYDLGEHPDKLNGRPVFFWHGMKDSEVPFDGAYEFYQFHKNESLTFIEDPNAGHAVTNKAVKQMMDWLTRIQKVIHP